RPADGRGPHGADAQPHVVPALDLRPRHRQRAGGGADADRRRPGAGPRRRGDARHQRLCLRGRLPRRHPCLRLLVLPSPRGGEGRETQERSMSTRESPRSHLLLPWAVQEREDPVLEFDRAEGMYFFDRQGKQYLDFVSQVFHCTLGHGNRRVIEAIQRQAERACVVSPQMLTADRVALAAELTRHTPGDLNRVFFVNSGSEANDQAFILARMLTGRPKIFAKYRSYHGTTYGTLGVGGDPRRGAIEPGPPGTVRFFDPYCYRCDFGLKYPDCRIHCLDALERQLQLENPATVAAVVVEPFTGAAGGFPLPDGYLPQLR